MEKKKEGDEFSIVEEFDEKTLKELEKKEHELEELFSIIKLVTPGTPLRAAIDDIAKAGLGALIVIGDSNDVLKLANGGFKIDCKFTPQKLVELCKMDGAILLSEDLQKIVYCNTLLIPDPTIETNETGTRHKAAERTAKQTNKLVIAISERRKTISLYYKNIKYVLKSAEELLNKTVETLRMLEKHREILNETLTNLNILEFTNLTTLTDAVMPIQRIEIMRRIVEIIRRYIIELGTEGNLVKVLLKEITKNLDVERNLLIKDYSRNPEFTKTALSTLSFDELIEPENIIRVMLYSSPSEQVNPKGFRLVSRTTLKEDAINTLMNHFKDFQELLNAKQEKLSSILGEKDANKFLKEIASLREQALLGKKI